MDEEQPKEIWVTFAGVLELPIVRRTFELFNGAISDNVKVIHLLIHCPGGPIADGIALYYFLQALPVKVIVYNCGSVCSAATTVFLGGSERVVAPHSTFMVHKTVIPVPNQATGPRLHAAADAVVLDDIRTEAILREHIDLTPEQWEVHKYADLTLSAYESIKCGLAHRIGLFSPAGPMYFI
jgi:ATP-dependent Clp protease, protease subunit